MRRQAALAVALGCLAAVAAAAARPYALAANEPQIAPTSPDAELVAAHCAACHSLDYILTQPPSRGTAFWQSEVAKMVGVYGAPVPPEDAARITAYLAAHY